VFLATSDEGLLLYNGYSTQRGGDFVSLSLRDGFIEHCFDLGTGPAIMRLFPAVVVLSVLFQPHLLKCHYFDLP